MTFSSKHKPQRTCSVCRVKSEKGNLIRVIKSPQGRAVLDVAKKLPGRGVYICPDEECIARARKSGSLAHALGAVIDEDFWPLLLEHAKNRPANDARKLRSILGLARKSGALLIGTDSIERDSRKVLVMTASDCSESVKKSASIRENISLDINTEELSYLIGTRGGVQIVGLPVNSGFAKKIKSLKNWERSELFE